MLGPKHSDTIDYYLVGIFALAGLPDLAGLADLRDHAVRLMKPHGRHGLRRCCDG